MGTMFMNSENSKAYKPHFLTLKLISKLDLRIGEKVIALWNISDNCRCRNIKSSYNNKKLANLHQYGMMNLNSGWMVFCVRYSRLSHLKIHFKKSWGKY